MKIHPGWENHLNWLLTHSTQAGLLVLLVLAVQWIFRRHLTHRWRFALWWIVLARLLLPFSPQSAMSLFNLVRPAVPIEAPRDSRPAESRPASARPTSVPAMAAERTQTETPSGAVAVPPVLPPPVQSASAAAVPAVNAAAAPKRALNGRELVIPWLAGLWLTGGALLSGVVLVQTLRFRQKLAGATVPTDARLQSLLEDCRREFRVNRRVELLETDAVQSPALFGLLKLRLLVPRGFGGQFNHGELRYVFFHELAHVKRGDLWLNWLVTALQIAHWFNPLLWFGFARLRADRELACDELTLLRAGDTAGTAYGETVVKLLENLSRPQAIPGLVGILEDKRQMRRRISMIANFRRPGKWSALAIVLIAGVAVATLTDAESNQPPKPRIKVAADAAGGANATNTDINPIKMTVTVLDAQTGQPVPGARVNTPYLTGSFQTNPPGWMTDLRGVASIQFPLPPALPLANMQNFSLGVMASNYPDRSVMWVSDGGKVIETLPDSYTFHLQKGITIGGFVRDDHGQPVAGAAVIPWGFGYRGFSMGTGVKLHQEYSEVSRSGTGVTTDDHGFWHMDNFPGDLVAVRVDVVRPGGARSQFTTEAGEARLSVESAERISLADLQATNAVLTLKDGYTIHGRIVNSAGQPVSGVILKARGGQVSQTPIFTCTNKADGTFTFSQWVVPQFVVTAEADGFASKTVVLSAADSAAEKQIVLPPAQPLRARVVGEHGEPVAGATFRVIDWRSGNQLVDWNGVTDASGLAVWTNAPDQPVSFWISSTNYPVRAAKLLADGTVKTVQLRNGSDKSITVHLSVRDAESGEPVSQFEVQRDLQWNQDFKSWGNPSANGEFQSAINFSEFRLGTADYYKLRICSDGYRPWSSDELYFDEGDQNLIIKLIKGVAPAGMVRQPDGQPAAEAKVVLCGADGSTVFFNAPNRSYPGRGCVTERTADDGTFHFTAADDNQYLVVTHRSGFASVTVGELRQSKEIQLQAWASVEGVLKTDGKPVANAAVSVKAPMNWNTLEGFDLVYSAQTDEHGHFLFTNLPPSDGVLYQQPHIIYGVFTVESHRWPFALKAGEHKQIDYTFGGRQIIGHVETETPVDWQNDAQVLVLKTKLVMPPAPTYWAYVNKTAYEKARKAYAHSPEVQAAERAQQQFELVFDQGGNFHADDVPPGDYELRLRVTRPPKNDRERFGLQRDELGSLTRDVSVPGGQGAFDLGTIRMNVKPATELPLESSKPAQLAAEDFDGKTVSLHQFKGKTVLLAFWADWSDRCTEQLAAIEKMQTELGASGQFTALGVNLDDDSAQALAAIKARGYSWPQARLDAAGRARAATEFNVTSLPSFDLIGPDGRVIAHDLDGKLVRATVERALKKQ